MKTIVIGSGGREHTIAWVLAQSAQVSEVVCIPGNGGTASEKKCKNIAIDVNDIQKIVFQCKEELKNSSKDSFVVVGPEDPLANGIVDALLKENILVVGPTQYAARLEASKDAAKKFMDKYGIACAKSVTCNTIEEALAEIEKTIGPFVIKADGLAAGKGVVVTADKEKAKQAAYNFMVGKTLGSAGKAVVIEEYLEGEEISILAAVSVKPEFTQKGLSTIVPFVTARDHKRLLDGAQGPNTGGMGAIAPVPDLDKTILEDFKKNILNPTLKGLIVENFDYRGFIFFGIILTKDGPKLLEYNVRLGDPETQVVLPLLNTDFSLVCKAIIDGRLKELPIVWKKGFRCAPVAVSAGYPGSYTVGFPIQIQDKESKHIKILFAGASEKDGRGANKKDIELVTSGGRVLAVSAHGDSVEEARKRSYSVLETIFFDGIFYRKDIGLPGAAISGFSE